MTRIDQGMDGTPFLTYYDKVHALSFVCDWTEGRWIDVSFGGAGEPVILRIPWHIHLTGPLPSNVVDDVLTAFGRACEEFVNQIHLIESVDDQAHGRTQA